MNNYLSIIEIFAWIIIGYFLGVVSFGYIVGKDAGVDIRRTGSGNIGTTNALRTLGVKAGLLTFAGDFLKAFIPTILAERISVYCFEDSKDFAFLISLIVGLFVVIGHNFPFWMKFKGGKGIAVTAGVTVAVSLYNWPFLAIAIALFITIVLVTRYMSVGSLCIVAWVLPVYTIIYERSSDYFIVSLLISFVFTVLAVIKHAPNIKRLMNRTENKLFSKHGSKHTK